MVWLAIAACGGGGGGENGMPGETVSSVLMFGPIAENPNTSADIQVWITPRTDVCADFGSNVQRMNATAIHINAQDYNTRDYPELAATYPVSGGGPRTVVFERVANDASCQQSTVATATAGDVIITAVSSGVVDGTYDVTLDNGEHLSASFHADQSCSRNYGIPASCI